MDEIQESLSYPLIPVGRVIAIMAACGVTARIIAEELNMEANYVTVLLKEPQMAHDVKRLSGKLYVGDPKKKFRALSQRSMEMLEDMQGDVRVKDGIRLRAATEVLDRAFGKPEQTVNVEGSLLRRVWEQMGALPPVKTEADTFTLETLGDGSWGMSGGALPGPGGTDLDSWAEKNL